MVNLGSSGPFPVPEAAVARHPGTLLSIRELRPWLEDLPLANPPKAAGMLLQQLRLLSRDPQPGLRFLALLDLYRQPLDALLEIVNERMQLNPDHAVPLDQLESLVVEALSELAYAELRIANAQIAEGRKLDVELLLRPMRLFEQALTVELAHYRSSGNAHWAVMQRVFVYADTHELADTLIKKEVRRPGGPPTIRDIYLRSLLIGCCDPYHHRPGQVLAWRGWTAEHTELLDVSLLPQGAASIPMDTSGTHTPLSAARCGKPGPDMRYLEIGGFLQHLSQDPAAPPGLHETLDQLIKGRRKPEERQTARQPRDHPYRVIFGLREIQPHLEQLVLGQDAAAAQPAIDARLINQSQTGAAFRLSGPVDIPFVIGEPLLAQASGKSAGGPAVGFTARIRRVMIDAGHEVEIGVEKLEGRVMPVTLSGSAAERARGDTEALLQQCGNGQHFVLIANRSVFREGDQVSVQGPSIRYSLRMQRIRETAKSAAYIDVEPVDY